MRAKQALLIRLVLCLSLTLELVAHAPQSAQAAPADSRFVAGRILIKFRDEALAPSALARRTTLDRSSFANASVHDQLAALGVSGLRPVIHHQDRRRSAVARRRARKEAHAARSLQSLYIANIPLWRDPASMATSIRAIGGGAIEYAEPDYLLELASIPNDPLFPLQWGLNNTGQTYCGLPMVADVDINAPDAWDLWTGVLRPVEVAVQESGVDAQHPELVGRVDDGWTCVGCKSATTDITWNSHGTAVAGIIAASGNNALGVAGINWGAKVVPVYEHSVSETIEGLDWARQQGIRIVNCSFGWLPQYFDVPPQAYNDACLAAFQDGILICAAMHNFNNNFRVYPAAYATRVLAVGAVFGDGTRWDDCNIAPPYACGSGSCYGSWIDLCGPGGRLVAGLKKSVLNDYFDFVPCSPGIDAFAGTSAATPVVSGVASLLLSYHPALTNEDLAQILTRTAKDVVPYGVGWDSLTGSGLVRAGEALQYMNGKQALQFQSGALVEQGSDLVSVTLANFPNQSLNGTRTARRHRYEGSISFGSTFAGTPAVWVRSAGTSGTSPVLYHDYNEEVDSAVVLTGSVSPVGCTVQTYLFELLDESGATVGWYPVSSTLEDVGITAIGPGLDVTPPAALTLEPDAVSSDEVSFFFTAPGDDGDVGLATSYEVRYTNSPINTNADFEVAYPVTASPPQLAGSTEYFAIDGLAPCTRYYIRARAVDEAGNRAPLSNQIAVRTLCSPAAAQVAAGEVGPELEMAVTGVLLGRVQLAITTTAGAIRQASIRVHDVSGRLCSSVQLGSLEPGRSSFSVTLAQDGRGRANAGVYFVTLEHAGGRVSKRCVWLP